MKSKSKELEQEKEKSAIYLCALKIIQVLIASAQNYELDLSYENINTFIDKIIELANKEK